MKKILIMLVLSVSIFSKTVNEYHSIIDSYLSNKNVKNKEAIKELIMKYSQKYNVNPLLITAMIQQESGFKHNIKSSAGAIGILQLMPFTAKDLGVNPYDLEQNILGGVKYISYLLEQNNRNIPLALASYNAGLGAVQKYNGIPPYAETQGYVKNIVLIFNKLKGESSKNNIDYENSQNINLPNNTPNNNTNYQINPEFLEKNFSITIAQNPKEPVQEKVLKKEELYFYKNAGEKDIKNSQSIENNNTLSYNNEGIRFFKAPIQKEEVKNE